MRSRILRAAVLASLLLGLVPALGSDSVLAGHSGGGAQIGGFEIDGDFSYPHDPPIAGATTDWATAPTPVSRGDDAEGSSIDDVFGGGAKEQSPDTWTFDDGPKPPGKDDLTRFYGSASVTASDALP
ncbi:MAG TPA: hypothetical protein VM841_09560 [Actinomycetota bacterium]|nr:hypothetical protein [Actinomycetota bacterium]